MSTMRDEELLKREHYAVIITETKQIWHEGDQRSRDAPGHGYPAGYETLTTVSYMPFETAEHVANWVKFRGASDRRSYRIIKAQPMKVTTTIGVSVSQGRNDG